jgi:predicted enzyme related to lactoylglutathione lyase
MRVFTMSVSQFLTDATHRTWLSIMQPKRSSSSRAQMPGMGGRAPQSLGRTSCGIFLYVQDVDSEFKQAVSAGAEVEMPLADMFWGDRYGKLKDPFGHSWSLATHVEDIAPRGNGLASARGDTQDGTEVSGRRLSR